MHLKSVFIFRTLTQMWFPLGLVHIDYLLPSTGKHQLLHH